MKTTKAVLAHVLIFTTLSVLAGCGSQSPYLKASGDFATAVDNSMSTRGMKTSTPGCASSRLVLTICSIAWSKENCRRVTNLSTGLPIRRSLTTRFHNPTERSRTRAGRLTARRSKRLTPL